MADLRRQLSRLLRELRGEGISDLRVLGAIEKVPRDLFVPADCRAHAFNNTPLPIGGGQTISQPLVVAIMTQALSLTGSESVLEVGTGSGYQAAVLAELADRVLTIERLEGLANEARERLASLGYSNVEVRVGDGSAGCPDRAPFDAIIVTAGCPRTPTALLDQLAEGGRLVLPSGSLYSQTLYLYTKRADRVAAHSLGPVRFVPLIGVAAWNERDALGYRDDGY